MGVETEVKEEVTIPNPSRDLLRDIVLTVPIEPSYVDITMVAYEIPMRMNDSNSDWKEYCQECKNKGVLPFTSIGFEYDEELKSFYPQKERIISLCDILPKGAIDPSYNRLIEGGKIHEYNFLIRVPAFEGFRKFRYDGLLQKLFEGGYDLESGKFLFYPFLDKNGDAPGITVHFKEGVNANLFLDEGASEEKRMHLVNWLDALKEKYKKINPLPADKHQAS